MNLLKKSVIIGASFLSVVSCYKKEATIVSINVVAGDGTPVPGAKVKLYLENPNQNLNDKIEREEITNATGVATFDYSDIHQAGQAGFAVLDIDVENGKASGIVKIEAEATSKETITCSDC